MKRILNQIFLILACIAFYAPTAYAGEVKIWMDDIQYTCNTEDGTAYVSKVDECLKVAEIKSAIECDGKEYPVTKIGYGAFGDLYGKYNDFLTSVSIPETVTEIGEYAFYCCRRLTSVTIPDSVTEIGSWAFSVCMSLTSVTIPDSVTEIGEYAFYGCVSLTSVTIPGSVGKIGADAFRECHLKEVNVPSLEDWLKIEFENGAANPTAWAEKFLINNEEIKRLVIPDGTKRINSYAFYDCKSLLTVTLPASVTSIGNEPFYRCSNLQRIIFPSLESFLALNYDSQDANLMYNNNARVYINSEPFNMNQVVIPTTISRIPDFTFSFWEELTSVTIPETVTEIGKGAFYECENLTSITLPVSVITINKDTFYGCKNLNAVTFPASLTTIGDKAFSGCSNLSTLAFPDSLTTIGREAFYGCKNLSTLTFPASLTTIGNYAFEDCSNLSAVTFPASLTTIGNGAFVRCSNLSTLTFPASLTTIGNYAFEDCSNLSAATFPASLTMIGNSAFWGCNKLRSVDISNVNDWAKIKFGDPSLFVNPEAKLYVNGVEVKHLDLDLGDAAVSDYAFYGAKQLESVRIKSKGVGKESFYGCSGLKKICIECDEVDYRAFWKCEAVETLYVPCETPPVASDDSFGKYGGVNLYVPAGCVSAYENAEACWWKFLDVYESNFSNLDEIFKADYVNSDSGVEEIFFDNSANMKRPNDIYNLQGVCLKRNATSEDIKALQPGLYIIGGKKIVVK